MPVISTIEAVPASVSTNVMPLTTSCLMPNRDGPPNTLMLNRVPITI
jgi:hypothetical protein